MSTGPAASEAWLTLFPGIVFALLGIYLRSRPMRLEKFLATLPGPSPSKGEIRWLPRTLLMVGFAWLAVFTGQVLPYPHGQRAYFILLLEILLLSASAAAFLGVVLWIVIGRRLLASGEPASKN